jgi:transcriptional regulator with XRE-family HTH domain
MKKGVSLKEASAKTGISSWSLNRYECGKATPREDNINKLAKYYGVEPSIFGVKKSKKTTKKPTTIKIAADTPTPVKPTTKTNKVDTDGLLERIYNKVSLSDFLLIQKLIEDNK